MNQGDKHETGSDDLERLYRRAADAEPDGRIDQAVLGKARKAASASRPRSRVHLGPWGVGLAAATSIVLAVGVVYRIGLQPKPASPQMQEFRAKSQPQRAADEMPGSSAGTLNEADSTPKPISLRKSEALDRAEVTGSGERERETKQAASPPEAEEGVAPSNQARQLEPEAWLERIRGLIQQGKLDDAREELKHFQTQYPSAEVPVEIRKALASEPD